MKQYKIIFSPTGGTEKVANAITSNWTDTETIDLSNNNGNYNISLEKGSLALIAMPSFGGLAPQLALDRLSKIKANNCKCAIIAVYGNRAYDDTLKTILISKELRHRVLLIRRQQSEDNSYVMIYQ